MTKINCPYCKIQFNHIETGGIDEDNTNIDKTKVFPRAVVCPKCKRVIEN